MSDTWEIIDYEEGRQAIHDLIDTIEVTGGLIPDPYVPGVLVPAGDDQWGDLAIVYIGACKAVGRTPMIESKS